MYTVVLMFWNARYYFQISKNLEFPRQICEKRPISIFIKSVPSVRRIVACGRTDRQTDMTKLIVVFRNHANTPKNGQTMAGRYGVIRWGRGTSRELCRYSSRETAFLCRSIAELVMLLTIISGFIQNKVWRQETVFRLFLWTSLFLQWRSSYSVCPS